MHSTATPPAEATITYEELPASVCEATRAQWVAPDGEGNRSVSIPQLRHGFASNE